MLEGKYDSCALVCVLRLLSFEQFPSPALPIPVRQLPAGRLSVWAKSVSVVLISIAVRLRCCRWWSAPRFALSNGVHRPLHRHSRPYILVPCLVTYGSTHSSFSAVATSATVGSVAAAAYRWVASVLPWGGISSAPIVGVAFVFCSPASRRALPIAMLVG